MKEFYKKTILITGGTSGIGLACAEKFSLAGADIIITGKDSIKGNKVVKDFTTLNKKIRFIACDMRSSEEIKQLFKTIYTDFGQLDFAINNAGIEGKPFTKIIHYPEETWDEVIKINLKAVWLCLKNEINLMLQKTRKQERCIVNIASIAGLQASLTGGAAYTASKHGVVGLTRSVSKEFAEYGIRINCICPALIKTPMSEFILKDNLKKIGRKHHPIGRIGLPQDIANTAFWLCSRESSFITGVSMPVDGGLTA